MPNHRMLAPVLVLALASGLTACGGGHNMEDMQPGQEMPGGAPVPGQPVGDTGQA